MSNGELLLNGVKLMVLGMGVVFAFLVLMVICMNVVSKLIKPFAGFFEPPAKPAPAPARSASGNDADLAAVAAAAVELFRNRK